MAIAVKWKKWVVWNLRQGLCQGLQPTKWQKLAYQLSQSLQRHRWEVVWQALQWERQRTWQQVSRQLWQSRWRNPAIAVVLLWLLLSVWQAPIVSPFLTTAELRGIWLTNFGASVLYHTTRLDEAMATIARHRLNVVYPSVWHRGLTLHPSLILKRAAGTWRNSLTAPIPGQDVLQGVIEQAHRQHLQVIPWFEYGLMVPLHSELARRHPDWLTQTQNRAKTLKSAAGWLPDAIAEWRGENIGWLNPFHPEVQEFLTQLITDVVLRYPVDGIQLDDHFGLPIAFGYDPYTLKLYQQEHQGQLPRDPSNPTWVAWRADRLTQLMQRIHQAVKAVKPQAIVSFSPNSPRYAYLTYLQDWQRWLDLGLLDQVIVQIYRPTVAALQQELGKSELQRFRSQINIGLYSGSLRQAKSVEQLGQEVAAVRSQHYQGISFFCWETTLWMFKHSRTNAVERQFKQWFSP
ncbi:MAG: family 10 glycosylhydrolase [Synechococcales bacterium]|nr:family 10 glycosylhydrolase [Synechococcales bacterium]